MMISLHILRSSWRGLAGWSAGIIATLLLYLPIFPSMSSDSLLSMMDSLPPALIDSLGFRDITTGAGYTQSTFFAMIGFILLTIATVSWGTKAVAGEEENGTLELTLAHAISRMRYTLESALVILVKALILGIVALLSISALNSPSHLELQLVNIIATTLAWLGLGMLCGAASLAIGAFTGSRMAAVGVGAGIAVVGYVFQALAANSKNFEWLTAISPFSWAFENNPLSSGFDLLGLSLLWGVSALLVAGAVYGLSRRDL